MLPERTLGMELHAVSNLLDRRMNAIISSNGADGITPMHGKMLSYISHQIVQGNEVYQKDVETAFNVARSTVTATLKLMEKKGYLHREEAVHDARLKRIWLTPSGKEAFTQIESSILQTEELMRSALTTKEYGELLQLLGRIKLKLWA